VDEPVERPTGIKPAHLRRELLTVLAGEPFVETPV
jgi:hypothetical protein